LDGLLTLIAKYLEKTRKPFIGFLVAVCIFAVVVYNEWRSDTGESTEEASQLIMMQQQIDALNERLSIFEMTCNDHK